MRPPDSTLSYVVASTPRTGSSLLCAGLWASRVAGQPGEVFAPDFRAPWREHWGLPEDVSLSRYLSCVHAGGRTPNGVFGTKIQWMHVAPLAREAGLADGADVFDALFGDVRFVNTVRRDRRAQALSWYRAISTGQWYRTAWQRTASTPETPSVEAIRFLEAEIDAQQHAWETYFGDARRARIEVVYEDLGEDYRGQVARVLAWLGLDVSAAAGLSSPHLLRQADDVTERWRHELIAEEGQVTP